MVRWSNRLALMALCVMATVAAAENDLGKDPGVELVTSAVPSVTRAKDHRLLSLSIVPRAGHTLHAFAPVTVRVDGHNVELPRPLFSRPDAVDPRADIPRFEIPVTVTSAHDVEVRALAGFWLCRGERCRPVEIEAHWHLSQDADGGYKTSL